MFAPVGAKFVAIVSARGRQIKSWYRMVVAMVVVGLTSASMPAAVSFAGKDPADPAARVAGIRYRSTIAPYTGVFPKSLTLPFSVAIYCKFFFPRSAEAKRRLASGDRQLPRPSVLWLRFSNCTFWIHETLCGLQVSRELRQFRQLICGSCCRR